MYRYGHEVGLSQVTALNHRRVPSSVKAMGFWE
jgi:hypothetical protein